MMPLTAGVVTVFFEPEERVLEAYARDNNLYASPELHSAEAPQRS
jgi:hypothetical protein